MYTETEKGRGGAGGSGGVLVNGGSESPVFTTGLSLELKGSCVVGTAAAARIPSFAGPMLSLMVRTSCDDERGWSRHEGVGTSSGCDGPEVEAGDPCCSPKPLVAVVLPSPPSVVERKDRGKESGMQELVRKAAFLVQETYLFAACLVQETDIFVVVIFTFMTREKGSS